MHLWPSMQRRKVEIRGIILRRMYTNCLDMSLFGTNWYARYLMVSQQTCACDHKMDQSLWQTFSAFDLLHSLLKWIQTMMSCRKHCKTMSIGIISRFWFSRRSWRFEIHFRWNIVRFWKSQICSNKLNAQEADMCATQLNRSWNYFSRCRIANGRTSRAWSLEFDNWNITIQISNRKKKKSSNRNGETLSAKKLSEKKQCISRWILLNYRRLILSLSNAKSSHEGSKLYIFAYNEAVIEIEMDCHGGLSVTIRSSYKKKLPNSFVSRTFECSKWASIAPASWTSSGLRAPHQADGPRARWHLLRPLMQLLLNSAAPSKHRRVTSIRLDSAKQKS